MTLSDDEIRLILFFLGESQTGEVSSELIPLPGSSSLGDIMGGLTCPDSTDVANWIDVESGNPPVLIGGLISTGDEAGGASTLTADFNAVTQSSASLNESDWSNTSRDPTYIDIVGLLPLLRQMPEILSTWTTWRVSYSSLLS